MQRGECTIELMSSEEPQQGHSAGNERFKLALEDTVVIARQ